MRRSRACSPTTVTKHAASARSREFSGDRAVHVCPPSEGRDGRTTRTTTRDDTRNDTGTTHATTELRGEGKKSGRHAFRFSVEPMDAPALWAFFLALPCAVVALVLATLSARALKLKESRVELALRALVFLGVALVSFPVVLLASVFVAMKL